METDVPALAVSLLSSCVRCVALLLQSRKLLPLFDRILIRRVLPQTKTPGGLLLPEAAQTKLNEGVVVAVGPGARHPQTGAVMPLAVKAGDSVLLPEYGGTNIVLSKGEEELVMYREGDLLGTFSK
jgi:chaperonin GroES